MASVVAGYQTDRLLGLEGPLLLRYQKQMQELPETTKSLLFYQSTCLDGFTKIPTVCLPYLGEIPGSYESFLEQDPNDVDFRTIVFAPGFNNLSQDVKAILFEGLSWGYQWQILCPHKYISEYAWLNQACLLGFINSQLMFSDNIEEMFKQQYQRYLQVLEQGEDSPAHREWRDELATDEFSMHYRTNFEAGMFGMLTDVAVDEYNYYERFGYPWGALSKRHRISDLNWVSPQLALQEGIGFATWQMDQIMTFRMMGFNPHFMMNPDLSLNLMKFVTEFAESKLDQDINFQDLEYLMNSVLHSEFNHITHEHLQALIFMPFRDKIQQEYGQQTDLAEVLIESQNAFKGSENIQGYVSNIMENLAMQSKTTSQILKLLDKNKDVIDLVMLGLTYFPSSSVFERLVEDIKVKSRDPKRSLSQVIQIQRKLVEESKHMQEEMGATIRREGITDLLYPDTEYSHTMLNQMRLCLSAIEYMDTVQCIQYVQATETLITDEMIETFLLFTRLYQAKYGESWWKQGLVFTIDVVELLVNLLKDSVDISKLLNMDVKRLQSMSVLLYQDPSIGKYLTEDTQPEALRIFMTIREVEPLSNPYMGGLGDYAAACEDVCEMLTQRKISSSCLGKLPTNETFWKLIRFASPYVVGLKELMQDDKELRKLSAFESIPPMETPYDLNKNPLLYKYSTQLEQAVDGIFQVLQEYCSRHNNTIQQLQSPSHELPQAWEEFEQAYLTNLGEKIITCENAEYRLLFITTGHELIEMLKGSRPQFYNRNLAKCIPEDRKALLLILSDMIVNGDFKICPYLGTGYMKDFMTKVFPIIDPNKFKGSSRILMKNYGFISMELEW